MTEEPGQITIKQNRFLTTGDVKPEEDTAAWWVPVLLNEEAISATSDKVTALTTRETTIKGLDTTYYKLNDGVSGFYRVNYPVERLAKIGENRDKLSAADRVAVIADAAAMAFSGLGSTAGLLSFLDALKDEERYLVWAGITEQLGKLRSLFAENSPEIKDRLKKFTLALVSPTVERVGWEFKPDEDFLTGRLRALILGVAGTVGHEGVVEEAVRRFKAYTSNAGDNAAIHSSLRLPIFRIGVAEGGQEAFDAVVKEYASTTTIDGREICLASLGRAREPEVIKQVLDFMLSDKVKVQDKHTPAIALSNNSDARYALWSFIQENWETIFKQMSGNLVVLDRFVKNSLNKFASHQTLDEIEKFFADKDTAGFDKGLAAIKDTVSGNAAYVERDGEKVLAWLKEHGY